MVAGIESLGAAFALHLIKEVRGLLHAVINLFILPLQRHVKVLTSENTENGSQKTMRTGERETVW
jgi:hypothetical protein